MSDPAQTVFDLIGPGLARRSDPATSHAAAQIMVGAKTSARWRLLQAHGRWPEGLIDEEAAGIAGLEMTSEYATRCSELARLELLENTEATRPGRSGARRMVRRITPLGVALLRRGVS